MLSCLSFVVILICHFLFVSCLVSHLSRQSSSSFVVCVVCCPCSLSSSFVIFVCHLCLSSAFVIFVCHLCSSSSFVAFIRYRRRSLVVFAEHLSLILFLRPCHLPSLFLLFLCYLPSLSIRFLCLLSSLAIFVCYLRSLSLFVIFICDLRLLSSFVNLSCLSHVLFVTFLVCHLPCFSFLSFVIFFVCRPHSLSSSFVIFVCSVRSLSASIYRRCRRVQSKQQWYSSFLSNVKVLWSEVDFRYAVENFLLTLLPVYSEKHYKKFSLCCRLFTNVLYLNDQLFRFYSLKQLLCTNSHVEYYYESKPHFLYVPSFLTIVTEFTYVPLLLDSSLFRFSSSK